MASLETSGRRGSTFLDKHQLAKVGATTVILYRKAAMGFVSFCEEVGRYPNTVDDWDDMLVEFKNTT